MTYLLQANLMIPSLYLISFLSFVLHVILLYNSNSTLFCQCQFCAILFIPLLFYRFLFWDLKNRAFKVKQFKGLRALLQLSLGIVKQTPPKH